MSEARKQATNFLFSGVMLGASLWCIEKLRPLVDGGAYPAETAVIIMAFMAMVAICGLSMVLALRSAIKLFYQWN